MSKNDQLAELAARAEGPLLLWGRSLHNFRQICSLFPSSPFVGRAMSWAIADRPAGHVVELGAGTGAVTRQLVSYGVNAEQLTLVEIDSHLGGHLRRTFPDMDVIIAPAQDLAKLWRERNGPPVGAVISTLPMRLFSKQSIMAIMRNCLAVLEPGGVLVQFTYRQRSPVPEPICTALGLTAERYCRVWINLPPAGIWVYRKPRSGIDPHRSESWTESMQDHVYRDGVEGRLAPSDGADVSGMEQASGEPPNC